MHFTNTLLLRGFYIFSSFEGRDGLRIVEQKGTLGGYLYESAGAAITWYHRLVA